MFTPLKRALLDTDTLAACLVDSSTCDGTSSSRQHSLRLHGLRSASSLTDRWPRLQLSPKEPPCKVIRAEDRQELTLAGPRGLVQLTCSSWLQQSRPTASMHGHTVHGGLSSHGKLEHCSSEPPIWQQPTPRSQGSQSDYA